MNPNDDLGRRLSGYLQAAAPARAPEWLHSQALLTTGATKQRRFRAAMPWTRRGVRLGTTLRTAPVVMLIAALIVASAGAAVIVAQGMWEDRPPALVPDPTSGPSGPGESVVSTLAGTWERFTGDGGWVLSLTTGGNASVSSVGRVGPPSTAIHLGRLTDDLRGVAALEFAPREGCEGSGTYLLATDRDGTLTLTSPGDSCLSRRSALEGEWHRLSSDVLTEPGSRYRIDLAGVPIDVTVPASFSGGELHSTWFTPDGPTAARFSDGQLAFTLMRDVSAGAAAVDRCRSASGGRTAPTNFDDYIAWSRASSGLEVTNQERPTVGGLPALRVDLAGGPACEPPHASSIDPTELVRGLEQREWVVDIGRRLIFLTLTDDAVPYQPLTSDQLEIGQQFVDSIEITLSR
jgi:hypothetical protein